MNSLKKFPSVFAEIQTVDGKNDGRFHLPIGKSVDVATDESQ